MSASPRCLDVPSPPEPMVAPELVGLVVRTRLERSNIVAASIVHLPGVEVHAQGDVGQLVVTVEGASRKAVLNQIDAIEQLSGVIAVSLVFSHSADLPTSAVENPA